MKDLFQKAIEELKMRVKENLDVINKNQEEIKGLLKQPSSPERTEQFEKFYEVNKNLLAQNNDYINIQLTLINFLEKYKGTAVLDEKESIIDVFSISDDQEVFDLTIKGLVPFDENHPQCANAEFIDKLIAYYEANEDYERCQELFAKKNKLVKH